MIVNQANLAGLNVAYSAAFNKALTDATTRYGAIATTVPSATAETSYKWLGQIPQMREWIGEREIQSLAAYDYSIKNKKFESTISVPRDDIEDDQYGIWTPSFTALGEEAALHPNRLIFEALQNGFTEKCYDGKSYFATDHESGDKTFSNKGTLKLTPSTYKAARTAIMSLTGDKGKSLGLVPNLLVVPPNLEEAGNLILKADQIDGTSNVYKGTAELLVAPELAATENYWFLLCTSRFLKPLIYQERKKIKLTAMNRDTDENVFMRDEFIWGVDGRSNAGYGFWQMAYGSTGETQPAG